MQTDADVGRPLSKRKAWVLADIVQRARVYDAAKAAQGGSALLQSPSNIATAARGFAASAVRAS